MEFCMRMATQLILKDIKEGLNKNFVMSPLSLNVMLNMIAMGSKGQTLEQLLGFLESKNISDLNTKSLDMVALASVDKVSSLDNEGPILSSMNGVWADQRFPLKPSFQERINTIFNAQSKTVDFVSKGEEVRNEVNVWVENATKGLIKDILPLGSLGPVTMLVLANALYFKGAWLRAFDASRTRNEDFHLLNGEIVRVPFMTSKGNELHFYGFFDDFKLLKLPYRCGQDNKQFFMYVFLPHKKDGLQDLIQKFDSDPRLLQKQYEVEKVKLSKMLIPKLKFSHAFLASDIMNKLGLTLPFSWNGDLTEMVDSPDNDKVSISNIFHKSCIEVDEEGTEAAAVSISVLYGCSMYSPPMPDFVADHPFMFMIKEEISGVVFFTGAVLNP